jgi:hypothetical protein
VHVQSAHALAARSRAGVRDEIAVTLVGGDLLLLGPAGRVRARCGDEQPVRTGDLGCRVAQLRDPVDCLVRRARDLVRDLDDGRV